MNNALQERLEAMRGGPVTVQLAIPADDLKVHVAHQIDNCHSSLARAYLRAGLYQATRQCMIEQGGKRYQCTRKWAEAATAKVWEHLKDLIPTGHALEGAFCESSTRVIIERDPYGWCAGPAIRFRCLFRINGEGFGDYGDVCMTIPTSQPLDSPEDLRVASWHCIPSAGSQNLVAYFNERIHSHKVVDPFMEDHQELGRLLQEAQDAGEWMPFEDVIYGEIESCQASLDDRDEIVRRAAETYVQQRHTLTVVKVA